MTTTPTLYLVQPGPNRQQLQLQQVWTDTAPGVFATDYQHVVSIDVAGNRYIVGIDHQGSATSFRFDAAHPSFASSPSKLDLRGMWDIVEPFTLGNLPYLLAYRAKTGEFSFFPVADDMSARQPLDYARHHPPGETVNFDVAQPVVINNALYYLGYSFTNGTVNIYSLSVTPVANGGSPPLISTPVWVHQWAPAWTRFAFFQMGGGAYFLKTNVTWPNVNIDHILDDPRQGTVEMGTHLSLDDAPNLNLVRPFYLDDGEPYFVTYLNDGKTALNRFHSDCKGWTTEVRCQTVSNATHLLPIQQEGKCFLLFI
jgi:hypothetical protein